MGACHSHSSTAVQPLSSSFADQPAHFKSLNQCNASHSSDVAPSNAASKHFRAASSSANSYKAANEDLAQPGANRPAASSLSCCCSANDTEPGSSARCVCSGVPALNAASRTAADHPSATTQAHTRTGARAFTVSRHGDAECGSDADDAAFGFHSPREDVHDQSSAAQSANSTQRTKAIRKHPSSNRGEPLFDRDCSLFNRGQVSRSSAEAKFQSQTQAQAQAQSQFQPQSSSGPHSPTGADASASPVHELTADRHSRSRSLFSVSRPLPPQLPLCTPLSGRTILAFLLETRGGSYTPADESQAGCVYGSKDSLPVPLSPAPCLERLAPCVSPHGRSSLSVSGEFDFASGRSVASSPVHSSFTSPVQSPNGSARNSPGHSPSPSDEPGQPLQFQPDSQLPLGQASPKPQVFAAPEHGMQPESTKLPSAAPSPEFRSRLITANPGAAIKKRPVVRTTRISERPNNATQLPSALSASESDLLSIPGRIAVDSEFLLTSPSNSQSSLPAASRLNRRPRMKSQSFAKPINAKSNHSQASPTDNDDASDPVDKKFHSFTEGCDNREVNFVLRSAETAKCSSTVD